MGTLRGQLGQILHMLTHSALTQVKKPIQEKLMPELPIGIGRGHCKRV